MASQTLEKSILETLAFFDLFQRPLTLEELEIYLWKSRAKSIEIENALLILLSQKKINLKEGFYCLAGSEKIFSLHLRRQKISFRKLQIAKKAAKFLQWVPFLRGIFLTQTVALENAKEGSDVDLLIITSKNRLWLCRFFVVLTIFLIGLRKSKKGKKNKICLSFYLAEDSLDISKTRKTIDDIYLPYWIASCQLLYSFANFYRFFQANGWVKDYIPNFKLKLRQNFSQNLVSESKILKDWRLLFEWLLGGIWGSILNFILGKIQIWRIYSFPEAKRKGANIWADDNIITMYHYDQREAIFLKWQENIKNLKIETKPQIKIIKYVLK